MRKLDDNQRKEYHIWIDFVTRHIGRPSDLAMKNETVAHSAKLELYEWIITAYSDLCHEAKNRITKEILDHYADAVYEHMNEGKSVLEAHRAAIESLGDPQLAHRTFKKTYLTIAERARLRKVIQPPQKLPLFLCAVMLVFLMAVAPETGVSHKLRLMYPLVLAFVVLCHIISSMVWSKRIFVWSVLGSVGTQIIVMAAVMLTIRVGAYPFMFAAFGVFWIRRYTRLWLKLDRDDTEGRAE